MLSGRRLDLLDPSPLDVEIEDVAHGLARVARWNGQTHGPHAYSVAQHSVLVEHIVGCIQPDADARLRLLALLHDAPEYVIGDMISPFKTIIGEAYGEVEGRLTAAIHLRYGLPPRTPVRQKAIIKRADKVSAYYEATELAGFATDEALRFFGRPPPTATGLEPMLTPLPVHAAQTTFIERFNELESAYKERGSP